MERKFQITKNNLPSADQINTNIQYLKILEFGYCSLNIICYFLFGVCYFSLVPARSGYGILNTYTIYLYTLYLYTPNYSLALIRAALPDKFLK
jgi:hypothetical protein